jgi:hypothetical protein
MANYYTEFSMMVPSEVGEHPWIDEWMENAADEESEYEGWTFAYQFQDNGQMWCYSGEGANIDCLADFCQAYLRMFKPNSIITFEWANTCSKPRVNSFSGGGIVITAHTQEFINTSIWVSQKKTEIQNRVII